MVDAGEEPENEEEVHVDTCIRGTSTGKRTQIQAYAFSVESEDKMVDFFGQNDCFYNKASPKYSNTSYQRKILQEFAQELTTECESKKY